MIFNLEIPILIVFFLWFLALTIIFLRFYLYYSRLIKNGKKSSLPEILDGIIEKEKQIEKKLDENEKKCDKLEKDSLFYVQKVGLVRFNPFKDTGGDQSFVLALVDSYNTGVIISSLHTRTGTRWYAKRVIGGKGVEYDLSEDEQKALKESKPLNKN